MITIETMMATTTIGLNTGALIWGAAKLSSKLDVLSTAFEKHVIKVDKLEITVNSHETDIARLWDGVERRGGDRRHHS